MAKGKGQEPTYKTVEEMTEEEKSLLNEMELASPYAGEVLARKLEGQVMAKLSDAFGPAELAIDLVDLSPDVLADEALDLGEVLDEWELVAPADLVGVPFIIVGVNLNETDLNVDGVYANVRCITIEGGRKVCFNDKSTGVFEQLKKIVNSMETPRPIKCKGGLRVSTYHWSEKEGRITEGNPNAATFYLSSSLRSSEKSKLLLSSLSK
jgi:hypothetical protein